MVDTSTPSMMMLPESGSTSLNSARASVDLPQPVRPAMPICKPHSLSTGLLLDMCWDGHEDGVDLPQPVRPAMPICMPRAHQPMCSADVCVQSARPASSGGCICICDVMETLFLGLTPQGRCSLQPCAQGVRYYLMHIFPAAMAMALLISRPGFNCGTCSS